MRSLAILSSPSHYYNLLECCEQLKLSHEYIDIVIFKFESDKYSNIFFDFHINASEWHSIYKIILWNRKEANVFSIYNIQKILSYFKLVFSLCCKDVRKRAPA